MRRLPHRAAEIQAGDSAAVVFRKRADAAEAHAQVMREQVAAYDRAEARQRVEEPLFAHAESYADSVRWAPVFHEARP